MRKQGQTIAELWDGEILKYTLKRNMGDVLMKQWYDVLQFASTITLNNNEDALI